MRIQFLTFHGHASLSLSASISNIKRIFPELLQVVVGLSYVSFFESILSVDIRLLKCASSNVPSIE